MRNILITGISGLLGGNLSHLFVEDGYKVWGTFNEKKVYIPGVNLIEINKINEIPEAIDVIIHCAAKTNVDDCEKNVNDCNNTNVLLTEKIIVLANKKKALLIHISTDAVYQDLPGKKSEEFNTDPLSVYAKTKLAAEKKVTEKADHYFIIRTNIFGYNILSKYSLAEWIYHNLKDGKTISGFCDVIFSPILVNDLYEALKHLITHASNYNQVFNIGSRDEISKLDFALMIADIFLLDKNLINQASSKDFGFVAPRASNSAMDSSKFETELNYKLPTILEGLQTFYKLHKQEYPKKLKTFNTSLIC